MRARVAALALMVCCIFPAGGQELQLSRKFPALRKSVPIQLLNARYHFYVLRYNKLAHDFFVEKREKPSCELVWVRPLRLDTLNERWFDISNLDYSLFMCDSTLCFAFIRQYNNSATLFASTVSPVPGATQFFPVLEMRRGERLTNFSLSFRNSAGLLFIFDTRVNKAGDATSSLEVYHPVRRQVELVHHFERGRAFLQRSFAVRKNSVAWIEMNYRPVKLSEFTDDYGAIPDSLWLRSWSGNDSVVSSRYLLCEKFSSVHNSYAVPDSTYPRAIVLSQNDEGKENIYSFSGPSACLSYPLDSAVRATLTFFDGPVSDPAAKHYATKAVTATAKGGWLVAGRSNSGIQKEMICLYSPASGEPKMFVVPRRLNLVRGSDRFTKSADAVVFDYKEQLAIVTLEHPANFAANVNRFSFNRLAEATSIWHSNAVLYLPGAPDGMTKRLLYHNGPMSLITLPYDSDWNEDAVFYLSGDSYEQFAIMK